MRALAVSACCLGLLALPVSLPAFAEPYDQYLSRLKEACAVECLQPRQFLREARKRDSENSGEMAVIMDVAAVEQFGSRFLLYDQVTEISALEQRELLGGAGVDISTGTGIGGLTNNSATVHPNTIIVELDKQTTYDLLNVPTATADTAGDAAPEGKIVVEGDPDSETAEPSLAELRSFFRNRRIVARGTPRLETVFVGGRRDFRRKQVTLAVDSADFVVRLPRYDSKGEVILSE